MGRHCLLNCKDSDQILIQFPQEGDKRREKWIQFVKKAIGVDNFVPKVSSKLCRSHFDSELFIGKCVKPFAVPTIVSRDDSCKEPEAELEETLYEFKKLHSNWHYQKHGMDFILFQFQHQIIPQIAHSVKVSSSDQSFTCFLRDRLIHVNVPGNETLLTNLTTVCYNLENQLYDSCQNNTEIDLLHPLSDDKAVENIRDYLTQNELICRFCFIKEKDCKTGRLMYINHDTKENYRNLVDLDGSSLAMNEKICESCMRMLSDASKLKNAVLESEKKFSEICNKVSNECTSSLPEETEIENVGTEVVIETEVLEMDQDFAKNVFEYEYVTEVNNECEDVQEEECGAINEQGQEDFDPELRDLELEGYLITIDVDGKRHFLCTKCNKEFAKKYSLDCHFKHNSAHSTEGSTTDAKCDECSSSFYDITTLKRHKAMVHDLHKTPCPICEKEFNAYHMNLHMKRHQKSSYSCPYCPKRFYENNYLLQEHIKSRHSSDKAYECEICADSFPTRNHLLKHISKSHPDVAKPFLCTNCGLGLWSKQALSSHHRKCLNPTRQFKRSKTQSIASIMKFNCNSCSNSFKTKSALMEHEQRHLNEEVHVCKICNKSFARENALRVHVQSLHLKEFQHFCRQCNKGFINASGLKQHQAIHSDERRHKCKICQKGFNRLNNLNVHIRTMHRNRRYRCKWCLESGYIKDIKKLNTFVKHLKTVHEIECESPENLEEQVIEDDVSC